MNVERSSCKEKATLIESGIKSNTPYVRDVPTCKSYFRPVDGEEIFQCQKSFERIRKQVFWVFPASKFNRFSSPHLKIAAMQFQREFTKETLEALWLKWERRYLEEIQ